MSHAWRLDRKDFGMLPLLHLRLEMLVSVLLYVTHRPSR